MGFLKDPLGISKHKTSQSSCEKWLQTPCVGGAKSFAF